MSLARGSAIFVSGIVLAALLGCSHESRDWHSAQSANTIEAYQQFLSEHPQGSHTADAQAQIAELTEARDWQRASASDTADAYRQFLAQHPQGKNAQEARIRLENFGLNTATAGAPAAGAAAAAPAGGAAAPPSAGKPAAAAPAPTSTGQYSVQLGAFTSHAKALAHWRHLSTHFSHEFAGSTPDIERAKSAGHHVFRLRVKGLTEGHAKTICGALRKHTEACIVGRPG